MTDFVYSLLGFVEVLFVELKADKVPLLLDGGYGGGAAADKRIENYPPRIVLASTNLRNKLTGFCVGWISFIPDG